MSAIAAYPAARGCDAVLDAWCNANCPHADVERLYARLDTNAVGHQPGWRCYAGSTLDARKMKYVRGDMYCTRIPHLAAELDKCRASQPTSATYSSEIEFGPDPTEGAAPAQPQQLQSDPMKRLEAELAKKNPQQQAEAKAQMNALSEPGPTGMCNGRVPASNGCHEWNGWQWCPCGHLPNVRFAGLTCEKPIGEGIPCAEGCEAHGVCVHGICECEYGWSGGACHVPTPPAAFLSTRSLLTAGLVRGREGSKEAAAAACTKPSWYRAYARNQSEMVHLLAALPDEQADVSCDTCALVSSAGSLRGKGHGKAIDANQCVWRMNRAPTHGYEKDVGSKTTLDWVNSFPHLRDIRILPRLDTPLLHGMTIEILDTRNNDGFEKFMGWLKGHVAFLRDNPKHVAYTVDIEWIISSWEAYWAYLAPWASPLSHAGAMARPSSGWHMARLALARCKKVQMYGFSMASDSFHYFDSMVQDTVTPDQRSPDYGITHRFAWEHEVFYNWSKSMPDRLELIR